MINILSVYKPFGATPLESLDAVRKIKNIPYDVPLAYAGRLDPLAEGVMLVLVGDACKQRDLYQSFRKQYYFSGVFGLETDTYDLLGMPKVVASKNLATIFSVRSALERATTVKEQDYPPYSSYRVNGKPLWRLARDGQLPSPLPRKSIDIASAHLVGVRVITAEDIRAQARLATQMVRGDFRNQEIADAWNHLEIPELMVQVHAWADVSSGTYIRSLVHEMGKLLGSGGVVTKIVRTAVGPYTLSSVERLQV